MTRQQKTLLISTFFIGAIAGFYIYVVGFAPSYNDQGVSDDFSDESLVIRGEQVGGCAMIEDQVCPSFEIAINGKYRFIPAHQLQEGTPEPVVGWVEKKIINRIGEVIDESDLFSLQAEGEVCLAATDGTDYLYNVVRDGVAYEFESCGTKFYGSLLYVELLRLWGLMMREEAVGVSSAGKLEGLSLKALLADYFSLDS